MSRVLLVVLFTAVGLSASVQAQAFDTSKNDENLAKYFAAETKRISDDCLDDIKTAEQWNAKKEAYRAQLKDMLGLNPWPEKTDLKVTVTGEVEHDEFTVKLLHFQSRPGLYVTANLYVPKDAEKEGPLPAILYVCGHGRVFIDGVEYGNKVHYQHHPAWFARNGYVCLSIDTLQLGEIGGIHHGTHREGMWWWLNRGYTAAGVEAWNCVRALDLLQSLDEVDDERIGVTGRSGGGAYSWWITAIDERIRCAVPVAGITDLENHVVDGCVSGHCDCMFMVNTQRWDYPMVAALVAPRPLLISNTDSDTIFPLDGVIRTHAKVKRLYELLGAKDKLALHITAGPHKDTQELRVHAFRWMNQHLKGETEELVEPAEKFFTPPQLKVLDEIPSDAINPRIQETFIQPAKVTDVPGDKATWKAQRDDWMKALREDVFAGWPQKKSFLNISRVAKQTVEGITLQAMDFDSQPNVRLRLVIAMAEGLDEPKTTELHVLNEESWQKTFAMLPADYREPHDASSENRDTQPTIDFKNWSKELHEEKKVVAFFVPRGVGPFRWNQNERKQTHIRRRFYLLGQTRDGMQVYDVRRAIQLMTQTASAKNRGITLVADGVMAGIGLYASLFEPSVSQLRLSSLPSTHRNGPIFLNVRRHFDMPQALAMAASSKDVIADAPDGSAGFQFATSVMQMLNREGSLTFRSR